MVESTLRRRGIGNEADVSRLLNRYRVEEAIERIDKTLERRITQRTAELEAANRELVSEISELKRREMKFRDLALVDDLTGLYNRRGFLALAEQHLKRADRIDEALSVLYADIDGLKLTNDSFGHEQGDAALCEVALILRETFRGSDIIARLAGDEFTVLLMATSSHTPEIVIARLHEKMAESNARETRPWTVSLSVGLASMDDGKRSSIEELMAKADERMYEQKRRRHNMQLSEAAG